MHDDTRKGPLFERHRPRSWAEVVGQDSAVRTIHALRDRGGLGGRAFWITGQSGTGKTTIGRLIAAEIAEPFFIEELDAQELTPARLREIEATMSLFGFGKGGRALIVNEAHGLRRDTVRALLVLLERLPGHVVVVFTTTNDGQDALFDGTEDAHPLLSRCTLIALSRRNLAQAFADRAQSIARAEGLDGKPVAQYVRLLQTHRNNMRAALCAIEAGAMADGAEG